MNGNLRLATCARSHGRVPEILRHRQHDRRAVPGHRPAEVKALWPLVNLGDGADTPRIIGALYHPDDGHIAPADLTMALRKGARNGGADIHENCEVTAATRTPSGEWKLTTTQGEITCEHVVCATGNYARQTGRMFGVNVPAIPVEHQYIVYDESPELKAYRDSRRSRTGGAARIRCVLLSARRAPGLDPRSPTKTARRPVRRRRARLVRQESVRRRPRPFAAARRGRAAPRAGARALRHQGHRQRPDLLHAGRQPADRAGGRRAQPVAERRATASASLRPAAPAGSSRNGSSRASRASTCWRSIRAASAPTPASATWSARTRKPTATSSRSTIPTRSAPTRVRARPARCTTRSTAWAPSGASATAGSAPTGSLLPASSAATIRGASAAATISSTSATSAGGCASASASSI